MKILVTGSGGYIGSFMTKELLNAGHAVIAVDSLERGHKEAIDQRAIFYNIDLLDKSKIEEVFTSNQIDAVIHFAAYISMGESMENPYLYFQNNVIGSLNLIETMIKSNVSKIIFSSTAGVYGNPTVIPIPEDHPKKPENPYGESKLMIEKILDWYGKIHGLNSISFRYFNAAGAALDGSMGERHDPESHIIPNIIKAINLGENFNLFGNDYKTKDGTCVRDYIHVLDLVNAHLLGLEKLNKDKGIFVYNVGTGQGYSNLEIINMVKEVSGKNLNFEIVQRRSGDADSLIADVTKIKNELGFVPKYSDLKQIVETAWNWQKKV